LRTRVEVQVSKPPVDIKFEKPHLLWLLMFYVQFSFQMSTRCPIGHQSENLKAPESAERVLVRGESRGSGGLAANRPDADRDRGIDALGLVGVAI
jgi:hypothetical protein